MAVSGWRWGMKLLVATTLVGCAHGGPPEASSAGKPAPAPHARDKAPGGSLVIGPAATEHGKDVLGAWIAYGATRIAAFQKSPPPPANRSADDYSLEYAGRDVQSAFWEKRRQVDAPAYPLFDRQVEIWHAGFLPELVVSVYAHAGWTIPGATIKALRLQEFAKQFSGEYDRTLAVAVISPAGVKFPEVPGADFPDPAQLPILPASCDSQRDARAAAWARWDALVPRLGGTPVSAQDQNQLAAALERVKGDPAYLDRGVTWVSWRVGHLAYFEGFCAVEAKDWPRATEMLSRAISLTPNAPGPRLELGMALGMVKRYDEALAQDRAVMEHTADGCVVATALRHQGYTYYDMGLLESARLAYAKSLEYEPGNVLAARELKGIQTALASRRGGDPRTAASFVPPPLGAVTLSKCVM